jgi:IstB-like ATP binding protein
VMISTNLVFSEWGRIFKDPMTTMAAIDRLVHHSVILDMMSVESYRAEEASQQHLLPTHPKKSSSRQAFSSENRGASAQLGVAEISAASLLVAENAGIETREDAMSHRQG